MAMPMFEIPLVRSKERKEFRHRADEQLSVVAPEQVRQPALWSIVSLSGENPDEPTGDKSHRSSSVSPDSPPHHVGLAAG